MKYYPTATIFNINQVEKPTPKTEKPKTETKEVPAWAKTVEKAQ